MAFSRSPLPAACAMARSWSVTLASALTTTTGFSGRRSRTMHAARSMAAASSTDVPPNFMMIMHEARGSIQVSLHLQQFRIEQRRARRPADGIVREHSELPVQQTAGTQPPYAHGHAAATFGVQPRLRTIWRGVVDDWFLGRVGQLQLLRLAAEAAPGLNQLFWLG